MCGTISALIMQRNRLTMELTNMVRQVRRRLTNRIQRFAGENVRDEVGRLFTRPGAG